MSPEPAIEVYARGSRPGRPSAMRSKACGTDPDLILIEPKIGDQL
jgi:hypothetical protein